MQSIQAYLKKRGIANTWEIDPRPQKKFYQVVVIPAYTELEMLPFTLDSLDANNISILENTLVIVVVNHGENSDLEVIENNKSTLQMLRNKNANFTLGVVDAASSGFELPSKQAGVGLARKIGMDLAISHLISSQSLIFCTDADTIVSKDYIEKVVMYFDKTKAKAAVVGFWHLKSNDKKEEKAIRQYEIYLLTTAEKMRETGSPYGYVAMGSTMVCTVEAYCAVGGMPRKKVTEDFYFLQALTKFCGVHIIPEILVYPSPRSIPRVYLGTGFRMEQIHNGFDVNTLYYSDEAFHLLSNWINLGSNAWKTKLSRLNTKTSAINPNLTDFLQKEGIKDIWSNLQTNAPSEYHFSKQFHCWFDGLKTIRLLKYFTEIS